MKNTTFIFLIFFTPSFAFQHVDINEANAEQIALLPGVGEKLAKSIVSHRQKNGLYAQEKDLLQVAGMRESTLKKVSALIIFGRAHAKNIPKKVALSNSTFLTLAARPVIELKTLEKQALDALGLSDEWERTMVQRARHSSMLPKLSLAFDYDHDVDLRQKNLGNKSHADAALKQSGNGVGVGLRAAFDVSELIFHKSELEIASLALKRLEKREKIIERIHVLYFRYQKLQESGLIPKESEEINKIKTELEHIAAALDSMSNGAFSRYEESKKL